MANASTLHIKIDSRIAARLKEMAKIRKQSVGELVRQAINSCYQVELLGMPPAQRRAVEAYQGGYISLGKLAEKMGTHVIQMRLWLKEHGIPENSCFGDSDAQNA